MKLSEIKDVLKSLEKIKFVLPNGSLVPSHFHVTEIGQVKKHFIDCGGTIRNEEVINFQLWSADDYNHRLHPEKLIDIIKLSEEKLNLKDLEIEVEYQGETIEIYNLNFADGDFILETKFTDCLAKDKCGITENQPKKKVSLSSLSSEKSSCTPNSGCC